MIPPTVRTRCACARALLLAAIVSCWATASGGCVRAEQARPQDAAATPTANDDDPMVEPQAVEDPRANPLWRVGATQKGFSHSRGDGKLVIEQSDLDDEFHVPIDIVRQAYGFDSWFTPRDGLIPGFRFDIAEHPEFAEFTVRFDESRAYFADHVGMHGVERHVQVRLNGTTIDMIIIVALSVEAAQKKLVPVRRQPWMEPPRSRVGLVNQLKLGDVNIRYLTQTDDVKHVLFTRHNVYFSMYGPVLPEGYVDYVAFAQKIDAAIQAITPVSMEELEQLRPRVTRFELEKDTLHGPKPETRRCAVYWDVDAPRGGKLTVFADGPDNLQYDDRANPSVIRGSTEGKHTARLIVIDEWLLFDWQDAPVEVR